MQRIPDYKRLCWVVTLSNFALKVVKYGELKMANTANTLSEFDIIVVVDASGSMDLPNKANQPNGLSRWQTVQENAMSILKDVSAIDADGIGMVFFNGAGIVSEDGVTVEKARGMFANQKVKSTTPMAEALTEALKLAGKSDKKDLIIVFTDGEPDDKLAVAEVIRKQSNSQETDDSCTILFIQVGDDGPATAYLQKLDDNLKGAKFDIVDVKTVAEVDKFATISDLLLAAISG